jgi:hypothetical protein
LRVTIRVFQSFLQDISENIIRLSGLEKPGNAGLKYFRILYKVILQYVQENKSFTMYSFFLNLLKMFLFNHKAHKEDSKGTKLKHYISDLCDLCGRPL